MAAARVQDGQAGAADAAGEVFSKYLPAAGFVLVAKGKKMLAAFFFIFGIIINLAEFALRLFPNA